VVGKPSWHDLNLEFGEPDVEWLKRANDAVEEMRLKPQADQVAKDGLQICKSAATFAGKSMFWQTVTISVPSVVILDVFDIPARCGMVKRSRGRSRLLLAGARETCLLGASCRLDTPSAIRK
jgi:hypothetical protein